MIGACAGAGASVWDAAAAVSVGVPGFGPLETTGFTLALPLPRVFAPEAWGIEAEPTPPC